MKVDTCREVRMLGRGVLSRLCCLTQQETPTLTLYVDIDQNKRANRNQGFLVQAEALVKELRARFPEDERLRAAAARALGLLGGLDPQGKTAVTVVHEEAGLADSHTLADVAIKFALAHGGVSTVIPGIRNVHQAELNTAACEKPDLPEALLGRLRRHNWLRAFWYSGK